MKQTSRFNSTLPVVHKMLYVPSTIYAEQIETAGLMENLEGTVSLVDTE